MTIWKERFSRKDREYQGVNKGRVRVRKEKEGQVNEEGGGRG